MSVSNSQACKSKNFYLNMFRLQSKVLTERSLERAFFTRIKVRRIRQSRCSSSQRVKHQTQMTGAVDFVLPIT